MTAPIYQKSDPAPVRDNRREARHPSMHRALAILYTLLVATCAAPAASPEPAARPANPHYEPTSMAVVPVMLALAGVTSADVVYDLGCGDGRIVIMAASRFGARGVCV